MAADFCLCGICFQKQIWVLDTWQNALAFFDNAGGFISFGFETNVYNLSFTWSEKETKLF